MAAEHQTGMRSVVQAAFAAPALVAVALVTSCGGAAPAALSPTSIPEGETLWGGRLHKLPVGSGPVGTPGAPRLLYYGGPILTAPRAVAVLWGDRVAAETRARIGGFFDALGASVYLDWLAEYDTARPQQHIGRASFGGVFAIAPHHRGAELSDQDVQNELLRQAHDGVLPAADGQSVYLVFLPPDVTVTTQGLRSCAPTGFCGYHGTAVARGAPLYYAVVADQGPNSGCESACGPALAPYDNVTAIASHELAEAITDPDVSEVVSYSPPLAWYDPTIGGGEIGDLCNAQQATLPTPSGPITVQRLWSNRAGECLAGNLRNGGFESGGLDGWHVSGAVSVAAGGRHGMAALLGAPVATDGDSVMGQTFWVPAVGQPSLSLWFSSSCADSPLSDWQQVELQAADGRLLARLHRDCVTADWRRLTEDLTPWKGSLVRLVATNHDDNFSADPSFLLIDDVELLP